MYDSKIDVSVNAHFITDSGMYPSIDLANILSDLHNHAGLESNNLSIYPSPVIELWARCDRERRTSFDGGALLVLMSGIWYYNSSAIICVRRVSAISHFQ